MKKVKLSITVALLTSLTALSQNDRDIDDHKRFTFGITAGWLTGTTQRGALFNSRSNFDGYYFGVNGDFKISEKVHVQPSLIFTTEGSNALILPVVLKYYVFPKINLQFGPQLITNFNNTFNGNKVNSQFDLDLSAGIGYDINEHFYLEARYNWGLTERSDFSTSKYTVNFLNVGVGYKF